MSALPNHQAFEDALPLTYKPGQQTPDMNALVKKHSQLVRRIAWHVHGGMSTAIDIEDLVQTGLVALVEAAGSFEDRGLVTFEQYLATRQTRRELSYEAMLAAGRTTWSIGDRVRIYRTRSGSGGVIQDSDDAAIVVESEGQPDYDVDHYTRLLRDTFAARLITAFTPEDYEAVFADPVQLSLFSPPLDGIRTVLTRLQ